MADGDVTYRFRVSVRLRHPSEDLTALCAELGLPSRRSWVAGERRTTPRGALLDGNWDHSYATMPIDVETDSGLEAALDRVAAILSDKARTIEQHIRSGGSIELFVGYFLEAFNSGFTLSSALMGKISDLGVDIGFDIYGEDEDKFA